MKILLSAYACEPGKGSESGVGWNWAMQIARFHEVWVITRANNRRCIEEGLEKGPLPNLHWIFYDLPRWARFWKKGQRGLYLYYYLWQLGAYCVARKLHREIGFDLAHHVTLGASWFPTFLHLLPVPFIWGPVGAGMPSPTVFYPEFSLKGRANEWARYALLKVSRLDPIRSQVEDRASMILTVSPATVNQLKPRNRHKARMFSQVGVDVSELDSDSLCPQKVNVIDNACFTVLSVGRLLHWKGFGLGIKAFAIFSRQYPNSQYWIVGEGPERATLETLVASMGLSSRVTFFGSLSRQEYFSRLFESTVLLYPSLHEPGAFVIAEAMLARRPVICLDLGEPASIVTEETGFRIPLSRPEQVIGRISEACGRLASTPLLCDSMGRAGRRRVLESFEWTNKAAALINIYADLGPSVSSLWTQTRGS